MKKFFNALRYINHSDAALNRKIVGTDRMGNIYYQYFDEDQVPTTRECVNPEDHRKVDADPAWFEWLRHVQDIPPTPEEIQKVYDEEAAYIKLG